MMAAAAGGRGGGGAGRLEPGAAALFVCDLQERFRPLISGWQEVRAQGRRCQYAGDGVCGVCVCDPPGVCDPHACATFRSASAR